MDEKEIGPIQVQRGTKEIPLEDLRVSEYNTRMEPNPEGVEELAESIKTIGLQNPLLVRPAKSDPNLYEVVSGSRRLQALRMLGHTRATCRVDPTMDDDTALLASLHENLKRGDITAMELSRAIQRLAEGLDPTWQDLKKRRWVAEQLGWHYLNPQGKPKPDANRVRDAILMGEFQKMLPGTVIKFRQRGDSKKPTIAWSTAKQVRDALQKSTVWPAVEQMPPEHRAAVVKEFADTYSDLAANKRRDFLGLFEQNPQKAPKELAQQLKEEQLKSQIITFRVDTRLWERIDEYASRLRVKRSDAVKQLVERALESLTPAVPSFVESSEPVEQERRSGTEFNTTN